MLRVAFTHFCWQSDSKCPLLTLLGGGGRHPKQTMYAFEPFFYESFPGVQVLLTHPLPSSQKLEMYIQLYTFFPTSKVYYIFKKLKINIILLHSFISSQFSWSPAQTTAWAHHWGCGEGFQRPWKFTEINIEKFSTIWCDLTWARCNAGTGEVLHVAVVAWQLAVLEDRQPDV